MPAFFLPPELIHVSARYTNAVLLAILPHISEFCQNAGLEISTPLSINQVAAFHCSSDVNDASGRIDLTNGFQIGFAGGAVIEFFDRPHSLELNNLKGQIPQFYGEIKLTRDEAIVFARRIVTKLGYADADLFADGDPISSDDPMKFGTNVVPFYRFTWKDPKGEVSYRIEIDACRMRMTAMTFFPSWWKGPIRVLARDEAGSSRDAPEFVGRMSGLDKQFAVLPHQASLTPTEEGRWATNALQSISRFAKEINLPISIPLTTNQVEFMSARYHKIFLKTRYEFTVDNGYVTHFKSPATLWSGFLNGHAYQYWGAWNMTKGEAVKMARDTLSSLNYWRLPFFIKSNPKVRVAQETAGHIVPRYLIVWTESNNYATVEIDASGRKVKAVQCGINDNSN